RDFGEKGELKSPLAVVALPDRTLLGRLVEEFTPRDVQGKLKEAHRKLGEGLGAAQYRALVEGMERANRYEAVDEIRRAVRVLEQVAGSGSSSVHQRLNERRRHLQDRARERLESALARWGEGRHQPALAEIDRLVFDFAGTAAGVEAGTAWKELSKTPEAKPLLKEIENERKARELYFEGMDLEEEGEVTKALSVLKRLTAGYPESLWTQKASSTISLLQERAKS
ncbi:MAG: hypothetical protein L0170_04010, partial [Acidobacteria bacterium]|nr:hypothetical protein [Acidobacteriota bacterium]